MIFATARTVALICLACTACSQDTPTDAPPPGRLPSSVIPVHYDISVEPDARALTFTGRAVIDVEVRHPTDTITLNALDLEISSARLDRMGEGVVELDPEAQLARLTFWNEVKPGRHRLTLDYRGTIEKTPAGLFAVDYDTAAGPRRMLATQFEVADGRRFAPMWDEPSAKATFALEVVIPAGESAYSNMPIASTKAEGEKQRIRFETSPRMSSYLLFLAVGELERISQTVAGVDVGVVTRKGAGSSGRYALEAAVEALPWFNDYFGTPYPLPKLDMIAVPGSSQFFAAMENWGAIMYFEPALLVDPRLSSQSDRQGVFAAVAHEVAHQWFGNLVTMDWWDDLWLNEGYATWMELKVESALHPERKPALEVMNDSREQALRRDAGAATHPVVQTRRFGRRREPGLRCDRVPQGRRRDPHARGHARRVRLSRGHPPLHEALCIRQRRDRSALGRARRCDGQARHRHRARLHACSRACRWSPSKPRLAPTARTPLTLSQGRFETGPKSAQRITWRIPVRLRSVSTGATKDLLLAKDGAPAKTLIDGCGPVIVNAGQAGYFRTRYTPPDLAALASEFAAVPEIDRLGLLHDTWALGEAGELPVTSYLELAEAVSIDSDPLILMQLADTFTSIDKLFDGSSGQAAWRAFARKRLTPVFERVGWLPAPTEGETTGRLREELIRALGRFEDPAVLAEARRRFARAARNPDALPAAIREATIEVVARHADEATWNELLALAKAASEPIEKERLFEALGRAADPALVSRALALALSGEVPTTFASAVIATAAEEHPELVFDFAVANEKAVLDLVDAPSRWAFIPEPRADIR